MKTLEVYQFELIESELTPVGLKFHPAVRRLLIHHNEKRSLTAKELRM